MDLNSDYNINYMDNRTRQLLRNFINNWEEGGNHKDHYNWENILNQEIIEYDCFRLYNFFTHIQSDRSIDDRIDYIAEHQKGILKNCKIFTLKQDIKHLLRLTKPQKIKEELKLPFNQLFLDSDIIFKEEKMIILGVLISLISKSDIEGLRTSIENNSTNLDNNIKKFIIDDNDRLLQFKLVSLSVLFFAKDKNKFSFVDILYDLDSGKLVKRANILGVKKDKYQSIIEKEIPSLVTNLLLFLNEPRVIIYIKESNNQRRERKGLIPIPSQLITKIEVGLKNYIEKIYFNGLSHSKLGFSFWVRGHWRRFLSPRFVNKQGQKIWILPYISGEGLMPPQIFEVTRFKDKQNEQSYKGEEPIKV